MSQPIVLKSFEELADALHLEPLDDETDAAPSAGPATDPTDPGNGVPVMPDLTSLLAQLEQASGSLAAIVRRDHEVRRLALQDLERYDAVVVRQREAEQAQARAGQVRVDAEALAERAFAEEARTEAARVAQIATQAEVVAIDAASYWRAEAEGLAARLDLERLLGVSPPVSPRTRCRPRSPGRA